MRKTVPAIPDWQDDPALLRERWMRLGFDQKAVAEALADQRISYDAIGRLIRGELKRPSDIRRIGNIVDSWISRQERLKGLTERDIWGYEDEPRSRSAAAPAAPLPSASPKLPVYGLASGGSITGLNHEAVLEWVSLADLFGGEGSLHRLIIAEVRGSSMEPRYRPGEWVVAIRDAWPAPGQDCLVELRSGHVEIKTYAGRKDHLIMLSVADPEHAEGEMGEGNTLRLEYRADEIKALHRVRGSIRR